MGRCLLIDVPQAKSLEILNWPYLFSFKDHDGKQKEAQKGSMSRDSGSKTFHYIQITHPFKLIIETCKCLEKLLDKIRLLNLM